MFNANNKTPERHLWRRSGVFCKLWAYSTDFSGVSIVEFEQVNVGWVLVVMEVTLVTGCYIRGSPVFKLGMRVDLIPFDKPRFICTILSVQCNITDNY